MFEMVQKEIKKRAPFKGKSLAKRDYFLSGLIICSCGRRMVGYSSARQKGDTKHYYYRCTGCSNSIKAELLENKVLSIIQEQIFNDMDNLIEQIMDYVAKKVSGKSTELKYLNNELRNTEQQINNIVNMIANGVASVQLGKKLQELETYFEGIKLRIAELGQNNDISKEKLEEWLSDLKEKFEKQENLKNLMQLFIKQIWLSKDDIKIDFFLKAPYKGASSSSAVPSALELLAQSYFIKR